METWNVIVKRIADKHYAICTGHLGGNHRRCVYNTEWTQKWDHTKSMIMIFLHVMQILSSVIPSHGCVSDTLYNDLTDHRQILCTLFIIIFGKLQEV
jgi:hypothetical protein